MQTGVNFLGNKHYGFLMHRRRQLIELDWVGYWVIGWSFWLLHTITSFIDRICCSLLFTLTTFIPFFLYIFSTQKPLNNTSFLNIYENTLLQLMNFVIVVSYRLVELYNAIILLEATVFFLNPCSFVYSFMSETKNERDRGRAGKRERWRA